MTARRYEEYALWAPAARRVRIRIDGVIHEMSAASDGWFTLPGVPAAPGSRYAFCLDDQDLWVPDPRSLSQPDGVHGESEVVDLSALRGTSSWAGRSVRGGVIYEMHVGTFTPGPEGRGGTFDSAIEKLDALVDLGVDAVEIMPVASFPGDRGWGYDGVGLYAVHEAYGGPAAMLRFVEAAHERGLAVILDVVHNHLGPAGNYLGVFGPYFTQRHETPWGAAVNLDDEGSDQVRAFLIGSARQWLVDMGLDGLRLDAVHELRDDSPRHFLAELSDAVREWERETGRELTLIAESDRNDPITVTPTAQGGLGMDMQWADDIHHAVHAWLSGERAGYYVDFGSTEVLERTLTRVFEHAGTFSTFREQMWGAPVDPGADGYDAHSFVAFLQDHDQVGNRAAGDRIHHSISAAEHRAGIALVLLGAATPMLFQGEEWGTTRPFAFFTDHDEELGPLVSKGRAEEFAAMGWADEVPDPQDRGTFEASILDWQEREKGEHAVTLQWYRRLIALRREVADFRDSDLHRTRLEVHDEHTVMLVRGDHAVIVHRGPDTLTVPWTVREVLAGIDADGALPPEGAMAPSDARTSAQRPTDALTLHGPGALVVRLV